MSNLSLIHSLMCIRDSSDVVTITANNGYFYANGVQLKEFSDKLWYKMRIEAKPVTQTADIDVYKRQSQKRIFTGLPEHSSST